MAEIQFPIEAAHVLMFARAVDATGGIWGAPVPLETAGNVGKYSSIAIVDVFRVSSQGDISS